MSANPYTALERVLSLRPAARRKLMRLEVACENDKCTPVRVFTLREGLLLQCRSDANVEDMRAEHPHLEKWSRRRAVFLSDWLDQPKPYPALQVVCDCDQTTARLVDVEKVVAALPNDETTRRVLLPQVAAHDR